MNRMVGKKQKRGEFELIESYFAPLSAAEPGAFNLTDDAAVLEVEEGNRLVVTTDILIAGVHFPDQAEPEDIAAKSLRVNLSDLAAMGAEARAYTLSLALPKDLNVTWLKRFSKSLAAEQENFQVTLIGGDTVATPGPLSLSICAIGTVIEGAELRRNQAHGGDAVYVSGTIGDAALGLKALGGELKGLSPVHEGFLLDRYHRPEPRLELGRRLAGVAGAAIDVSDGLAADLGHICAASKVSAAIEAFMVPLSEAARSALEKGASSIAAVLGGGDDYELLFTAPPKAALDIERISAELGLPITPIGHIKEGNDGGGVTVVDENGNQIALPDNGYRHF